LLKFLGDELSFTKKISNQNETTSGLTFLRAKAYDELNFKNKAIMWYKTTLTLDNFNIEAFDKLTLLLSSKELLEFLKSLNISTEWLNLFYSTKLNQFDFQTIEERKDVEILENKFQLSESFNVKTRNVEYFFYQQKYRDAYEITKRLEFNLIHV
jgi:hypothetical protein